MRVSLQYLWRISIFGDFVVEHFPLVIEQVLQRNHRRDVNLNLSLRVKELYEFMPVIRDLVTRHPPCFQMC